MGYQLPSGPTREERHDFYVSQPGLDDMALANLMEELDKDVEVCRVASHAGGTLWGIIQSREDVSPQNWSEFDYIGYAKC